MSNVGQIERKTTGAITELSFHVESDGWYLDFAPYADVCD